MIVINPEEDGKTHINVYSKGKTSLGRFLSNFALSPFTCEDGNFNSVEGYWYWLGTNHPDRDQLRKLVGFEAKQVGRVLNAPDWKENDPEFKSKILKAINAKILMDTDAKDILKKSTLPFRHYYVYGGKVVEPKDGIWILEHLEWIRKTLKSI